MDDFESEIYFDPHGGAAVSKKEEYAHAVGQDEGAHGGDLRKPKVRPIISPTSAY